MTTLRESLARIEVSIHPRATACAFHQGSMAFYAEHSDVFFELENVKLKATQNDALLALGLRSADSILGLDKELR